MAKVKKETPKEKATRQPANVGINASFMDVIKISLKRPKAPKKGK